MVDKQFQDRKDFSDISREEILAIGDKALSEFVLAAIELSPESPEFKERGAAYCAHANHVKAEIVERNPSGSHSK